MDSGNYGGALETYSIGLSKSEKNSEDYVWFLALIGEVKLHLGRVKEAIKDLDTALNTEYGDMNPYIIFRLAQAYYEDNDLERAKRKFFAVYHLTGDEFFADEDQKYWNFISKDVPKNLD